MRFTLFNALIALAFCATSFLAQAQSNISVHGEYTFPQSVKYDPVFGKPETITNTHASLLVGYTAFQHLTISVGPSYSSWESTDNYRLNTLGIQADAKFTINITQDSAFKAGVSLGTRRGLSTDATSLNPAFTDDSFNNSSFSENYAGLFFSYLIKKRLNIEVFPLIITTTSATLKGSQSPNSITYQNFRNEYGMIRLGFFF